MNRKNLKKAGAILFWLAVWQGLSLWISNDILLVGPLETIRALCSQAADTEFWLTVLLSSLRIGLGLSGAFLAAVLLGGLAFWKPFVRLLLEPVVTLAKSIPVASFVVLLLIWAGSDYLSVWITALVVFPIVYQNTLGGLGSVDGKLLEMARVFRMPWSRKLYGIYRPALLPYLLSGCRVAAGMAWKSGVAAEVIGQPDLTVGNALYMAKIYLSTAELFAWTFVVIALSFLFEQAVLRLLKLAGRDCLKEGL